MFCLSVRSSGIAASVRLRISDEWTAQDLDNVVAYRLLVFDNDKIEQSAKAIAAEVWRSSGMSTDDDNEPEVDRSGAEVW